MFTTSITRSIVDSIGRLAYRNYHFYSWLLTHMPAYSNDLGLYLAYHAFEQARSHVPAYQRFLSAQHFVPDRRASLAEQFSAIPATDKNNYVRLFSSADRCVDGHIPVQKVIVDESSGSTGVPYNWVRSRLEVEHVRRACSYFHRYWFGGEPLFVINGFSMGAWTTGVTVGSALESNGIVKSTGPDIDKILHTLRFFGPHYRYLITGYPPFLKRLLDAADAQSFDWTGYRLVATVGGEGMSENLRAYLLRHFEQVFSGYGASDLEIGVAAETNLSVTLRQLMIDKSEVRHALIGDEQRIPMLFQYNPLDYYIETNSDHELLVTINRQLLSPRIRYNIKDEGGVIGFDDMCRRLRMAGVDLASLLPKHAPRLPFLYVFGRRDSTLSYMGANIYPEDIEAGLLAQPALASRIGAFSMELQEQEQIAELRPCIHVEVLDGQLSDQMASLLQQSLRDRLCELNADFRQAVYEDASAGELRVELHLPGHGPFAQMNGRIKNRYILENTDQRALSVTA